MILRIPFETSDWTSNKILSSSTSEAINAISIVLSSSKETRSRSTTTGASFIGFTVISNCWETTSVPSETFTVIKEFPYLLSNGSKFNVYVPLLLIMSSLDKLAIKLVLLDTASTDNMSPSISEGWIWIVILSSSSFTESGSGIADRDGASLIFTTFKLKDTASESICPSFAITEIVDKPK